MYFICIELAIFLRKGKTMSTPDLVKNSLDSVKRISDKGIEYWMARDLLVPLGYEKWDNFERVIDKARQSCESTGEDSSNHFLESGKKVGIGSGAERAIRDFVVSRFGAYLIAMNGSPQLPQIAAAQRYFAVQTRRQEISDQQIDVEKRLELRDRVKEANVHLGYAAKDAGVQHWGLFHDAGYRGLYGIGLKEIKARKGLDPKEDLLDRSGRAELAANEFRITQTEEALKRNQTKDDLAARETHRSVGKTVRDTIHKLGGTMPEELPAEPSIKQIEAKKRKAKKIANKKKTSGDQSDS